MKTASMKKYIAVALSFAGSAILLFSCDAEKPAQETTDKEHMLTEYSEDMSIVMTENGRKSYHFETPLIEGYNLARDPYREFRKGIKITTYTNDSLATEDAVLTANYAIYYENRRLWEAKGDVVVIKADGKKLYTSQLFWNQATKKIYSNVDSKIVNGDEVTYCEGFESDESMKEWRYRKIKGITYFTVEDEDSTSTANPSSRATAQASQLKPEDNGTATDSPSATPKREKRDLKSKSLPLREPLSTDVKPELERSNVKGNRDVQRDSQTDTGTVQR